MASLGTHVGQGAMWLWLASGVALVGACSSDSTADFDAVGGIAASDGSGGNVSGGSQAQAGSANSDAGSTSGGKTNGGNANGGAVANAGDSSSDGGTPNGSDGGEPASGGVAGKGGNGGKGGTGGGAGKGGTGGNAGNTGCTSALFEQHQYYFCGTVDSAAAALSKCLGFGMGLLTIESKAENAFAVGKQAGSSWLGGSDALEEEHWQWADGSLFWEHEAIDGKFSSWANGQPNDNGPDGSDEDCLVLEKIDNEGRWNDLSCTLSGYHAACEAHAP